MQQVPGFREQGGGQQLVQRWYRGLQVFAKILDAVNRLGPCPRTWYSLGRNDSQPPTPKLAGNKAACLSMCNTLPNLAACAENWAHWHVGRTVSRACDIACD